MSPKPSLDADRIVEAALATLEEHGLEGVTMRRIADRLDVQNPALYWHFANRQAIVDQMAERVLRAAAPDAPADAPWQAQLLALARGLRRAILAHRDGARLLASADLSASVHTARVEDAVIRLLGVGFPPVDALTGVLTLVDYTLGATLEEQTDPHGRERTRTADDPPLPQRLATLLAGLPTPFDGEAAFEGGLRLIIRGLEAGS